MRLYNQLSEKWCISLHFHSVTLTIKADHEAAEDLVCHRGPSTKDSEKWLSLYADWLRSILYCYLLTFGNLSMLISSEVTLGKLPRWQKCLRSSHKTLKRFSHQLHSKNNCPVLLYKPIFRHWNCFLPSNATDGKYETGLKLKGGPTFSSFSAMPAKVTMVSDA